MSRIWLIIAGAVVLLTVAAYAFRHYIENEPISAEIADAETSAAPSAAPPPTPRDQAIEPAPDPLPPAAAGDPPEASAKPPKKKNGHTGSKVLSYFQQTKTKLDSMRAFGFVLMPKEAVTDDEKRTQKSFCELMLASLDFMTPEAVASTAQGQVLATYWPVKASRGSFEIKEAFAMRNCDDLLAWYDHALARKLATNAGVAELSGPLLITWPSGDDATAVRDPLIVDFSKANHERATKALQYWFRQLKNRPELWTNRIREGTIRTELADAVNDTAGVVLAVMSGKWESLNTVATP